MATQRFEEHFGLLEDIGAISSVLSESTDLQGFLDRAVVMVAEHLQAEVCSIYLYNDATRELVLHSTHGLHVDAVGKVKLELGEGLVGTSMKELRPICVDHASTHPDYRYFPELGEEPFESFLAVPILRGSERIGVLTAQRQDSKGFAHTDVLAMRALTAQLAASIETARTLMQMASLQVATVTAQEAEQSFFIKGRSASAGHAIGPCVHFVRHPARSILAHYLDGKKSCGGAGELQAALDATMADLRDMQHALESKLPEVAALIFEAHMLMLKDSSFTGAMRSHVESGGSATGGVAEAAMQYIRIFEASQHDYVREKAHDVTDLALRILKHLDEALEGREAEWRDAIVTARELLPSDILMITLEDVAGIILCGGGVTSHISIVVRALAIPMIVTEDQDVDRIAEGDQILLDADGGNAYVNPGPDVLARFTEREMLRQKAARQKHQMDTETRMADGHRVHLYANINLLSELDLALDLQAEGVGLYRTEFPFLVRPSLPTAEEQFLVYSKLLDRMEARPVYIRTLDAGGDKMLPYLNMGAEPNPALGLRSTRLTLLHRDVLRAQLRAILRAGDHHPDMRIMFPMICSPDEFRQARALVLETVEALSAEAGQPFPCPAIGMMVELPSTVELAEVFAQEADFFSIGTNDFIQYMLAVDRNNTSVIDYYCPHHPAVLRGLRRIAAAAKKHKIDCSVCGEMAHDPQYIPFFLGIGIRHLSVDPHYLPDVQQCVSLWRHRDAEAYAKKLVAQETIADVEEVMKTEMAGHPCEL